MSQPQADYGEYLPWCWTCEAYSNPLDDGSCGQCGDGVT